MAIGSITTTTGKVYDLVKTSSQSALRTDMTNSTATNLKTLEISHQDGNSSKPARHLMKLTSSVNDSLGNPVPFSLHTVITVPTRVVTETDIQTMALEAKELLNPALIKEVLFGALV